MQTQNRPSGTLNGIAIFCGILFTFLITILLWMSDIRIPLSLAIGICSGIVIGYSILHYLYNNASDKLLGWVIHHAQDPLEILIEGGKDGVDFDPTAWENPGREIKTDGTLTHSEGNTGWTSTVIPNVSNPNVTPEVVRTYEDPITRLERRTMEFWNALPSLESLLTQMLETKETFVFSVKAEVLGKEFSENLQKFMENEMPWIKERLMHVYANYNGMNTQRLFVWSLVEPVVTLGQQLLAIQREAQLNFSDLQASDAQKILDDVMSTLKQTGQEFNFDQVEQLYTGSTERTVFEHVQERAVEKQSLTDAALAAFEQRWAYFDTKFSYEVLSPFTLNSVEGKSVWHPLFGLQILQRLEFWNFITLKKYTAEELSWKFIHATDATNGSESFFEAFKETVRFYKRVSFDSLVGRDGNTLLQSRLIIMNHEENIDKIGNLHFITLNNAKYEYDSNHIVYTMRNSHSGDKAAELLYIQFKNASLQNDRYLLLIIDKSVNEVRCFLGDKIEQTTFKVQLLTK
ncbi:hypothetical protein KA405_00575 [Patescibacteria group bacterium]|nr:hypothetical protein [Patescibacteria group bacterium]